MLQIPIVSTYHTTYEDYTHYVNVFNLESVDKVAKKAVSSLSKLYGETSTELIAPSQKTKEMLQRYGIKKRIHVIPTGLDLQRFDAHRTDSETRKQRRQELMYIRMSFIIFVGRIGKKALILDRRLTYLKEAHVLCILRSSAGIRQQEACDRPQLGLESMITLP
ncbi:MAG: glycosyltransferase [Holdemania massiliensis]